MAACDRQPLQESSKVQGALPASNGIYRDGKGTLYEGGTRVVALANWPGHIKPGDADGLIHVVDMYPTIAALIGAKLEKNKPLDGIEVWKAISEGAPSPRKDMVYNVDPMAGAVREGDMKLVWKATLPPTVELFDLAKDKSESDNLAATNPAMAQKLQASIVKLAEQMAPPLLLIEAIRLTFGTPPMFPDPATAFNAGD